MSKKYPRTPHLPYSPGGTRDDARLISADHFIGQELIITEKMDGSNVCFTHENMFARSHTGAPNHPSFDMAKAMWATLRFGIDPRLSIFSEWLYAVHSIRYSALHSYLQMFGVRDDVTGNWLSWNDVEVVARTLAIATVPVLWRGRVASEKELMSIVEHLVRGPSCEGAPQREGVVVRLSCSILASGWQLGIAKWVRSDHVQTDDHWTAQKIVLNHLK